MRRNYLRKGKLYENLVMIVDRRREALSRGLANNILGLQEMLEVGLDYGEVEHIRKNTKTKTSCETCFEEETVTYIVPLVSANCSL